ncbi:MAG: exo-alpha-sialidase [Oscillochloridaceae bacterium umkhey_bin13]
MRRLIMLVMLLTWLVAPTITLAQRSGWSTPFELSPPQTPTSPDGTAERVYGSSWFPDLTAAPDGTLFASWYSGKRLDAREGGSLDLLMLRAMRAGSWGPIGEVLAPATGGLTVRNAIVVARDGRLHAVYRSNTSIVHASAPFDQADDPASWSQPTRLSGFGAAYYVALEADSRGSLHAFFSESMPDDPAIPNQICPGCSDLFYRRSTDGGRTWSVPLNLSTTLEGENRPQVQVDQFDRIHVVWDEGIDWYAGRGEPRAGVYRRSDDGGLTWSEPVRFQLPERAVAQLRRSREQGPGSAPPRHLDAVVQTTLGLDGQGNPLVVFRGAYWDRIYSTISRDGGTTWEQPVELAGLIARQSDLDSYSMATDGSGMVHLLVAAYQPAGYTGDPFAPIGLWHLTWNGRSWVGRESVMNNELYPEWPRLIVNGGNQLHAVWFTRSRDDLFQSERARYRVWYSNRSTNAPAVVPLPLFTPTPLPVVAPTAPPQAVELPIPTALPEVIVTAPPMLARPAWEAPGLLLVGLALAPVVLLLGGILLFRALRGRR